MGKDENDELASTAPEIGIESQSPDVERQRTEGENDVSPVADPEVARPPITCKIEPPRAPEGGQVKNTTGVKIERPAALSLPRIESECEPPLVGSQALTSPQSPASRMSRSPRIATINARYLNGTDFRVENSRYVNDIKVSIANKHGRFSPEVCVLGEEATSPLGQAQRPPATATNLYIIMQTVDYNNELTWMEALRSHAAARDHLGVARIMDAIKEQNLFDGRKLCHDLLAQIRMKDPVIGSNDGDNSPATMSPRIGASDVESYVKILIEAGDLGSYVNTNDDGYKNSMLLDLLENPRGCDKVLKIFLDDAHGRVTVDVNYENEEGDTALMLAAGAGREEAAKMLAHAGADATHLNGVGDNALFRASRNGHMGTINVLLQAEGVDVNEGHEDSGDTSLFEAARKGHVEAATLLLDAGSDVNAVNVKQETCLFHACYNGYLVAQQMVEDAGFEQETGTPRNGKLHHRFRTRIKKYKDMIELLIARNANVNHRSESGETALSWAAWIGHTEALELLIAAGAHVDEADNNGDTSLFHAVRHSVGVRTAQILLCEGGANTKLRNNSHGDTALHACIRHSGATPEMVRLLLEHGSFDLNARAEDGHTAMSLAAKAQRRDIAEILHQAGAAHSATGERETQQ